ncbi:MAG: DUF2513 domain-containing protein [Candidatus Scalindua sp.]|nr:DUF2513 domain-containing protein [Candidatus Scalindua sp.]
MKRDMDLIRKLLFYFEQTKDTVHDNLPKIEGYDANSIKYHIYLLYDSKLLHCEPVKSEITGQVLYLTPLNVSWDGNEFLEKVRSDITWEKIKKTIVDKGEAFSFSNINQITNQKGDQEKYCLNPDFELKWQKLIDRNPGDLQVHALHALRLGLYLKEERGDITNNEASRIFENIKMSLVTL